MDLRKPVTPETLQRVGDELAGAPVSREQATAQAAAFEPLMAAIARLRSLPLKEVEPAFLYAPEEEVP